MNPRYKVLALVSGGKDSCYSMVQCVAAGHEIVALANLCPEDESVHELDSYMYQTVGHSAVSLYAEAMGGLPLFKGKICGGSVATKSNDYSPTRGDEVEDLYDLLVGARYEVEFDAVCTGAILSDYQRIRVENVCSRLGLVSLAYLWRRDQSELLDEMLQCGKIEAIIVKVATLGLERKHLGSNLRDVRDHLHRMHDKFGINICGEGGEYETFTLDCPLFCKAITVDEFDVVIHSDDAFAQVAYIKFKKLSLRDKGIPSGIPILERISRSEVSLRDPYFFAKRGLLELDSTFPDSLSSKRHSPITLDKWSSLMKCNESKWSFDKFSGEFHVNNLFSMEPDPKEATKDVFKKLEAFLTDHDSNLSRVTAVTLLVGDMTQYALINSEYIKFFNHNPPVRVCVQANIQFPLVLSASGFKDGKAMHVQSISHWAPANIGPYSQAVEASNLLFLAGQIGLVPGSMSLENDLVSQAQISWRHLIRVLEVYNLFAHDIILAVCFVTVKHCPIPSQLWQKAGESLPHLIVVEVPRLPRDALVEWQVVGSLRNIETETDIVPLENNLSIHQSKSFVRSTSLKCFSGELKATECLSVETLTSAWSNFASKSFLSTNGTLTVYFKPGTIDFTGPKSPDLYIPVVDFSNENVVLAWTFLESLAI